MTELEKHIEEIAIESGVDLEAEAATSGERTIKHGGHEIDVFYEEDSGNWVAWVDGIGSESFFGDEERAVDEMKYRLDNLRREPVTESERMGEIY